MDIDFSKHSDSELVNILKAKYNDLRKEIKKVIVGQDKIVELVLAAILCNGHCLLIGVPGLAKTLLVKTISEVLDLKFSRIQFTPDLMPADITGTEILDFNNGNRNFKFVKGPVFANIILADEINRTPPKTQSALLEAMQEHRVTVAGISYTLEEPFFVIATQNPIEQEGTYPLPEAQLDRFMYSLMISYPEKPEEIDIVKNTTSSYEAKLEIILRRDEIINFQQLLRRMPVADEVYEFTVNLVRCTRPQYDETPKIIKDYVSWGAGPRASQYLILGAKALALLDGRFTPSREDVLKIADPVLRHRVILNFNAEADNVKISDIIATLKQ
ncbi:MAG: AAA family ATPase [Ignavibacteria bacterium]